MAVSDPPAPEDGADRVSPGAAGAGPRPAALAAILEDLNPAQREAVLYDDGPLVVVAGAGSGKTRVLTRRIARLVATGVSPWRILGITFTNKAADEVRRRVVELVGAEADKMWLSTFHSACARILRRETDRIGYRPGFSIYDEGDSRRLVEHVLGDLGIDAKRYPSRAVLGAISAAKAELLDAPAYEARAPTRSTSGASPRCSPSTNGGCGSATRSTSTTCCRSSSACSGPTPRCSAATRSASSTCWSTSTRTRTGPQNEIVTLIGAVHRNVCVVGDTDQSIYRFRGAEIRNLLEFELAFPEARTIVLDQNYRSTQTILDAANAVIGNNLMRQEKSLWSALGEGEKVLRYRAGDERGEATFVANEIEELRHAHRISARPDRRLLPHERAEPGDRAGAGGQGRAVPGDRGRPFLRPP